MITGYLRSIYNTTNRLTHGGVEVLWKATRLFIENQSGESAASLAFYAIFSLFPLLAVVVTVLSFFADEESILRTLIQFLIPIFPVSQGLISENVRRFIDIRGTVGVVGLLGLVWSASSVFAILGRSVNRAWDNARVRNFLHDRLFAFGLVGAMLGLLILAQIGTSIIDILNEVHIPGIGNLGFVRTFLGAVLTEALPALLSFFIFLILYKYVPTSRVRYREAFWGALIVTLVWEITSRVFAWYIGSGLINYDLLYGSIATLTILMLWFYINSLILIYGAYISAGIARRAVELESALSTDGQTPTQG